jgi:glycosyltransferase involved in cell wall biosynthesis
MPVRTDSRIVNRRPWPFAPQLDVLLPATLPEDKPWPKISVVTPSFNQGRYIEETILSVLNQEYPNLEYIVVDGGSTDETMAVVHRYRDRIAHLISENDKGQSHAINKGMALATGDLLTWLNSDDMLEVGALAGMAMAFHTSNADIVAGVCRLYNDQTLIARHVTSCGDGPLPVDDLLDVEGAWLPGQFFYQPEVMFTRALWERAGAHVNESLFYSMDYELWLRFAEQGALLHVIGRPICRYRVHEGQKTFEAVRYRPELLEVRNQFISRTGRAVAPSRKNLDPTRSHLRVIFFNDLGSVAGAGIAHQRLAAAMAMAGHEVIPLAIAPHLIESKLAHETILQSIAERSPDLVIMGNIHSARLDPALIGLVSERWPTVQVLHDLYSLTGRCAYPGECTKYLDGCDQTCPTAEEYPSLPPNLIHAAWETKLAAMTSQMAPIVAGVSEWTARFARHRFDGGVSPHVLHIRYGLPLGVFRPYDQSTARDLLGLPQDRFLILFSASHLSETRKGLIHLIEALRAGGLPDLMAVCIGHFDAPVQVKNLEIRSMGYVSDPAQLSMLYSAVDLFVGPSLVETFGQVFIEAAACGTPSIGYATAGGVAEAIADGVSGELAPTPDAGALQTAIENLYKNPELRRHMSTWGRLWIENEYSLCSAYQRLFAQLNKIGLIGELGLAPKVAFFRDSVASIPVTYLESVGHAAAVRPGEPGFDNPGLAQLPTRLSIVEAERDFLKSEMRKMTQTRLWRMVAAVYPVYRRILVHPAVPRIVRRRIETFGRWLAHRSEGNPQH